ncbi:hypothetical protein CHLRE_16g647750v5 [Chlamydomonas reinhardtii]|uniref:Uncharacterized protein n=1 Tax=Chlamydomonas reinhardtii TaxID=3055 RepID=A8J9N3_CHLRE|nr:uncharacterized protein CHLRE_16g647750v5 [Chlamydomonas reinhardtii]PNW71284.1 hypothetical protein CHLRE_16g647750v5 [Chlamydomonas reinhardtii]|eukprot:XP_001698269.1 predicted protein [Chlamydomonas reinhardtii]
MSTIISIEQFKQLLEDALKPIKDEVAGLSTKVDVLSTKVAAISTKLDDVSTKLDKTMVKVDILVVKQQNSAATRSDRLQVVPRPDGSMPTVDFPESILQLLVAGNESLPDGSRNTWNKSKSKSLLRQYEDASESESETDDNEYSSKSRARRLKLARLLGISNTQLNFAQMTL